MLAEALTCMALNIYHEARNESTIGQLAVAQVVMNRVEDDRFPNDVCAVIKQGEYKNGVPVKDRCQFSWYCDGLSDEPRNKKAYAVSYENAKAVMAGHYYDVFEGATHYHATYVLPKWAHHHTLLFTIDQHIFYRWD
jgi:N-acetylmuramoyl-L-alanine amidase